MYHTKLSKNESFEVNILAHFQANCPPFKNLCDQHTNQPDTAIKNDKIHIMNRSFVTRGRRLNL